MGWLMAVRFDICRTTVSWNRCSRHLPIDILLPLPQKPPIVPLGSVRKLLLHFFVFGDVFIRPGTLDTAPCEIFCGRSLLPRHGKVWIGNNEWEQFERWELIGTERDSEEEICNWKDQQSRIGGSQVVRMQTWNARCISLEGERRHYPDGKRRMLHEQP